MNIEVKARLSTNDRSRKHSAWLDIHVLAHLKIWQRCNPTFHQDFLDLPTPSNPWKGRHHVVGRGGSLVDLMPFVRRFESRSSHHIGTITCSCCLWRFGVKLIHSIRAVSGVPLSSSGLGERYINSLNEWMFIPKNIHRHYSTNKNRINPKRCYINVAGHRFIRSGSNLKANQCHLEKFSETQKMKPSSFTIT